MNLTSSATLGLIDHELTFAQTMITAGWLFGAVADASVLSAAVGLLQLWRRRGELTQSASTTPDEDPHGDG